MGMGAAIVGSALIGGFFAHSAAETQAKASEETAGKQAEAIKEAAKIRAETADKDREFNKWMWEEQKRLIMPWWKAGKWALAEYQKRLDHIPKFTDKVGDLPQFDESLLPDFKFEFNQNNPAYQFRLKEGINAIQSSAAAKGNVLSGATMRALERYGQGLASQEYENEFQRQLTTYQQNRANTLQKYNLKVQKNVSDWQRQLQRYDIGRQNYLTMLNQYGALSGVGQLAANTLANKAENYTARNIALNTAAGEAQARGVEQSANALAQGQLAAAQARANAMYQMGGIVNNAIGNYLLYNLLGRQGMLGFIR